MFSTVEINHPCPLLSRRGTLSVESAPKTYSRKPALAPSLPRPLLVCLTAALLLVTAGCDETFIDPFDNDNRFFTIYGYLDESKNFDPDAEHVVRVIPVTRFPERITSPTDDQATIDAVVVSIDLRTGVEQRWEHALEQLSDGAYAHIFRTSFFVQRERTYRLEVRRSDGVTASAETTIPSARSIQTAIGPPVVDPATGAITQEVHLTNTPSPWDIDVIYRVGTDFIATPYPLPYGRPGTPTDDGGWRFTINVTEDRSRLSAMLGIATSAVEFPNMALQVRLLDGQWTPPEGLFDPEVLAQPGTLSNVVNGYGFWGSIGLYQHNWRVSDELRGLLGF